MKRKWKSRVGIVTAVISISLLFFINPAMSAAISKDNLAGLVLYQKVVEGARKSYIEFYKKGDMVYAFYNNTLCSMALEEMNKIFVDVSMPYSKKLEIRQGIERLENIILQDNRAIKDKIHQKMLNMKSLYAVKVKNDSSPPELKEFILYYYLMRVNLDSLARSAESHNIAQALFCSELGHQIFFEIEGLFSKIFSSSQAREMIQEVRAKKREWEELRSIIMEEINFGMNIIVEQFKAKALKKTIK